MKLAGNQSYFFPYVGYFQLINAVDKFILYDNLNFIDRGWVNRNRILIKNSGASMITVPLLNSSSNRKILDIEISDKQGDAKWREKLCKTLYVNYRHSPMFDEVFPLVESLIKYQTRYLSEMNANAIISICKYLNLNTEIEFDSNKYQHIEGLLFNDKFLSDNYRDIEKKIVRVIEICKQEEAEVLYNAIGGADIYSKEIFRKFNIELKFLKSGNIVYKQYNDQFVPNLSIIDLMMFNGISKIHEILSDYDLL